MEILAVSGATVVEIDEDELGCMVERGDYVRDLKRCLAHRAGFSRFQQRLVCEGIELKDDMPFRPIPSLQLVIVSFCAPETEERLIQKCRENKVDELEQLLQRPLDPNARDAVTGDAPIHVAAQAGHLEVMRLLLDARADMTAKNRSGSIALTIAAANGHKNVVRFLQVAQWVLAKNASKTDLTKALLASACNGHLEVLRLLLEARADMNARNADGETALLLAAQRGHLDVVQCLLDAGAAKHVVNERGTTALQVAAEKGHQAVVKSLLNAGAY